MNIETDRLINGMKFVNKAIDSKACQTGMV